jgi:hypothetical protein
VAWERGQQIVRREVWRGRPWMCTVVFVVDDGPDMLVTYLPEGAPFSFPRSADGRPHPWLGKERWRGHGVLMLQRPAESYAVWHFWDGPERRFAGWYLNLQRPLRRTPIGYDTQDLELDVWIPATGHWSFKDEDKLEERRADGRFTEAEVVEIRSIGSEIAELLDRGERWWDETWTRFEPDPSWREPTFPAGWDGVGPDP